MGTVTVWTLEVGTDYQGHEVAGVYASAADALAKVAESDALLAAGDWDGAFLAKADSLRLLAMRVGADPCDPDEAPHEFERDRHGDLTGRWWIPRRLTTDPQWSGTAADVLAMVAPAERERHNYNDDPDSLLVERFG